MDKYLKFIVLITYNDVKKLEIPFTNDKIHQIVYNLIKCGDPMAMYLRGKELGDGDKRIIRHLYTEYGLIYKHRYQRLCWKCDQFKDVWGYYLTLYQIPDLLLCQEHIEGLIRFTEDTVKDLYDKMFNRYLLSKEMIKYIDQDCYNTIFKLCLIL